MKKILVACRGYYPDVAGGGEISTKLLTEQLSSLGYEVEVLAVSDADYKDLIRYIQNKHITVDPKQLAQSKPVILNDLKVLLYKYYLGDTGYYKALNVNDKMVKQALLSLQ